jgi:hypothetical protein
VHGPRGEADAESSGYWFAKVGAGGKETLHVVAEEGRPALRPEPEAFTPNLLRARVDAPSAGAVLVYDDTWDPAWTATVNGAPREIARSDHGGKALRLDAGRNDVEFRYRNPARSFAFFLLGLNAFLWLGWIVLAAARAGLRGAEVA